MKRSWYNLAVKARKIMNECLDNPDGIEHDNNTGEVTAENRSRGACATTVIVTEKGVHICPNQACHAGLDNDYYPGFPENKGERIAVVSSIQSNYTGGDKLRYCDFTDEDRLLFIDWLINRSPYAPAFVNRSAKDVLKHGFICNTDVPSNLMAGGLIASRIMWEYTNVFKAFVAFVKGGMNENAAFMLAHVYIPSVQYNGMFVENYHAGHCSINGGAVNDMSLRAFIENKPKSLNKNYIDKYNYAGVHAMFSHHGMHNMRDLVKPVDKADIKEGNPFYKSNPRNYVVPDVFSLDCILKAVNEVMK